MQAAEAFHGRIRVKVGLRKVERVAAGGRRARVRRLVPERHEDGGDWWW
jgi:hypothetical protein